MAPPTSETEEHDQGMVQQRQETERAITPHVALVFTKRTLSVWEKRRTAVCTNDENRLYTASSKIGPNSPSYVSRRMTRG
jgi:hypothetical protein